MSYYVLEILVFGRDKPYTNLLHILMPAFMQFSFHEVFWASDYVLHALHYIMVCCKLLVFIRVYSYMIVVKWHLFLSCRWKKSLNQVIQILMETLTLTSIISYDSVLVKFRYVVVIGWSMSYSYNMAIILLLASYNIMVLCDQLSVSNIVDLDAHQ